MLRHVTAKSASSLPSVFMLLTSAGWASRGSHGFPNALQLRGSNWVPTQDLQEEARSEQPHKVKRWRLWLLILVSSVVAASLTFLCGAAGTALLRLVLELSPLGEDDFLNACVRILVQSVCALCAYLVAIGLTVHSGRQLGQFIGGSGIPELKCELGGVHLMGLFNHRVLVGKLLGLAFAIGSGLPVGCEGPFVHASCCINHSLMCWLPVFHGILDSRKLRHMATSSMVAVGVACTFGAPLGGVLYALEVTDSFQASNYVPCFFGATIAGIVNSGLRRVIPKYAPTPLFETDLKDNWNLTHVESVGMLLLYIFFGCLCGVLGACFVQLHSCFVGSVNKLATSSSDILPPDVEVSCNEQVEEGELLTRSNTLSHSLSTGERVSSGERISLGGLQRRCFVSAASIQALPTERLPAAAIAVPASPHGPATVAASTGPAILPSVSANGQAPKQFTLRQRRLYFAVIVTAVGLVNGILIWSIPVLRQYPTQPRLLNVLVSSGDISWGGATGEFGALFWHLGVCFLLKFISTACTLALPLPMGSVAPAFVLGAIFGRLVGNTLEALCDLGHYCGEDFKAQCAPRLAMIGASAFVAGSMQSFAQVIIVFELTCLPDMLLPLCTSALTAIFTAQRFSKSFFDSVIELKKLPYLPSLASGRDACNAEQIMRREFPVLPISAGPDAIANARARYLDWHFEVPIVDGPELENPLQLCPQEVRREHRFVVMLTLPSFPVMSDAELRLASQCMRSVQDKARFLLKGARSPVLVPHNTPLKVLLSMLISLERSTAFVTQNGYLVGAVTMADLYSFACGQKFVETAPHRTAEGFANTASSLPPLCTPLAPPTHGGPVFHSGSVGIGHLRSMAKDLASQPTLVSQPSWPFQRTSTGAYTFQAPGDRRSATF